MTTSNLRTLLTSAFVDVTKFANTNNLDKDQSWMALRDNVAKVLQQFSNVPNDQERYRVLGFRTEIEFLKRAHAKLKLALKMSEDKLLLKDADLIECNTIRENLQEQIEKLSNQNQQMLNDLKIPTNQHLSPNQTENNNVNVLQQELELRRKEIDNLRDHVRLLNIEKESNEQQLAQFRNELQQTKLQSTQYENHLHDAQTQLQSIQSRENDQFQKMLQENLQLQKKITEFEQNDDRIDTLKIKLKRANDHAQRLQEKIQIQHDDISLQQELTATECECKDLRDTIENLSSENLEKNNEIQQLHLQMRDLQNQIQFMEQKYNAEKISQEEEIQKLRTQEMNINNTDTIENLKLNLNTANIQLQNLLKKNKEITNNLKTQNKDNSELKTYLKELMQELSITVPDDANMTIIAENVKKAHELISEFQQVRVQYQNINEKIDKFTEDVEKIFTGTDTNEELEIFKNYRIKHSELLQEQMKCLHNISEYQNQMLLETNQETINNLKQQIQECSNSAPKLVREMQDHTLSFIANVQKLQKQAIDGESVYNKLDVLLDLLRHAQFGLNIMASSLSSIYRLDRNNRYLSMGLYYIISNINTMRSLSLEQIQQINEEYERNDMIGTKIATDSSQSTESEPNELPFAQQVDDVVSKSEILSPINEISVTSDDIVNTTMTDDIVYNQNDIPIQSEVIVIEDDTKPKINKRKSPSSKSTRVTKPTKNPKATEIEPITSMESNMVCTMSNQSNKTKSETPTPKRQQKRRMSLKNDPIMAKTSKVISTKVTPIAETPTTSTMTQSKDTVQESSDDDTIHMSALQRLKRDMRQNIMDTENDSSDEQAYDDNIQETMSDIHDGPINNIQLTPEEQRDYEKIDQITKM